VIVSQPPVLLQVVPLGQVVVAQFGTHVICPLTVAQIVPLGHSLVAEQVWAAQAPVEATQTAP
jgi:hypothetical protein